MVKYVLLLSFLCSAVVSAQVQTLFGEVLDSETMHPLPSATLRIIGTSKGTVTNSQGQFKISLPEGRFDIAVSYLGYRSDTISTSPDNGRFRTITLEPNTIELSGVTVTDEDPAYEIIRRAIESKKRWMPQLRTFEGKAFSRLQFRNDSSIAAITESYSTLYWSSDDSIREVVTQQRQTGNLMKGLLSTRVGDIINFNEDRIKLGGVYVRRSDRTECIRVLRLSAHLHAGHG